MWNGWGEKFSWNPSKSCSDRDKPGNVVVRIPVDGFVHVRYAGVFGVLLELKENFLVGGKSRLSLKDLEDGCLDCDIICKR